MKTFLITIANIIFLLVFATSCDSDNGDNTENDTTEINETDTNIIDINSDTVNIISDSLQNNNEKNEIPVSKYICPQGDKEGNSDKFGICPVCEMELIENPDYINKNSK